VLSAGPLAAPLSLSLAAPSFIDSVLSTFTREQLALSRRKGAVCLFRCSLHQLETVCAPIVLTSAPAQLYDEQAADSDHEDDD
jgi:hypothetical protein